MKSLEHAMFGRRAITWVAVLGCAAVSALAWLGYVAVRQWQESTLQLSQRQAEDASDLLIEALARDMQGVQRSALFSIDANVAPVDLADVVDRAASAFGGYSYPESFFFWSANRPSGVFLDRRDRPPGWAEHSPDGNRFPVVVRDGSAVAEQIMGRLRQDAQRGRPFAAFDMRLGGAPYQVVARLTYADRLRRRLDSVFAFTVNLGWVREHYFEWVAQNTMWTEGPRAGVALAVLDERDGLIAASEGARPTQVTVSRTFPLFFFNPLLVATGVPADLGQPVWTVQGGPAAGSSLLATSSVAQRMLMLQGVTVLALLLGLWLTVRAGRAGLRLTQLRTDFVSSVTHEFKTPIATIAGAGELLASGRIQDSGRQREYAGFIIQESRRLSRLVDNLLAFARITDATVVDRHLEWITPSDLIAQALQRFAVHIEDGHFEVEVDAPPGLPAILGDVSALRLMIENLVDNAIRHARTERAFTIRAQIGETRQMTIEVEDRGGGIPEDEIQLVTRKFFRGRAAGQGGTGLGLAIASRIAKEHGGSLQITSRIGSGTTVRVILPPPAERPPSGVSSSPADRDAEIEHDVELADSGGRG